MRSRSAELDRELPFSALLSGIVFSVLAGSGAYTFGVLGDFGASPKWYFFCTVIALALVPSVALAIAVAEPVNSLLRTGAPGIAAIFFAGIAGVAVTILYGLVLALIWTGDSVSNLIVAVPVGVWMGTVGMSAALVSAALRRRLRLAVSVVIGSSTLATLGVFVIASVDGPPSR